MTCDVILWTQANKKKFRFIGTLSLAIDRNNHKINNEFRVSLCLSTNGWTQEFAKHKGKSQFESVTLASQVLSNFPTASFDERAVAMNQLLYSIAIIFSNVSSKTI